MWNALYIDVRLFCQRSSLNSSHIACLTNALNVNVCVCLSVSVCAPVMIYTERQKKFFF